RESLLTLSMVSMHSIQGDLRKNGEFINNQGGALLHHNSPIPWSTFAQYLTVYRLGGYPNIYNH
ncbi:hypothetical protein KUG21_20780, partial [Yersinia enterocolitica]|uniref:hypothetical protein n=3 Tax=Yersinia enterocolitica TaxID=630 RepID=UPI001EFE18EB